MIDFQTQADKFGTETRPVPQASWMSGASASFAESWEAGPVDSIGRSMELASANAETGGFDEFGVFQPGQEPTRRTVTAEIAQGRATEAGVSVDFGTASYTEDAVGLMIGRAVKRKTRAETVASSGIGVVTQFGSAIAAGLVDPINLLAAFTPIAPVSMVARIAAAETVVGRAGARALVGTVEGAAGAALIEPFNAFAKLQEGQDYGVVAALQNIAFGAAFGAVVRPLGGGAVDVWRSRGRTAAASGLMDTPTPEDVAYRLDGDTQMAALRQAADDLIAGNPVKASEVIDRAAAQNPELARGIKVSASLRRDGPEIDDIVARQEYWLGKLKVAAIRRQKIGKAFEDASYTGRLLKEAGVKPRTKHVVAARMMAEYERKIVGAERVHADPEPLALKTEELFDESQLPPEALGELAQERVFINEVLARDTAEIDNYAACLFGGFK